MSICAPACGRSRTSGGTPTSPTSAYVLTNIDEMLSEKVMGSSDAPVTVIEYSSLTCPHCATFHVATLVQIKAAYIDTGKVRWVYRDFPVPGASTSAIATAAAALARCAGNAAYFDTLGQLYRTQSSWIVANNPKAMMKQMVSGIGMASERMDACMSSAELAAGIEKMKTEGAATYNVYGTPTFIIDGKQVFGAISFAEFEALLAAR